MFYRQLSRVTFRLHHHGKLYTLIAVIVHAEISNTTISVLGKTKISTVDSTQPPKMLLEEDPSNVRTMLSTHILTYCRN